MTTPIIPLNLFQTWSTKNLEPGMKKCVDSLISQNPEFKYFLFDDNDCRTFIKKYFNRNVLNAYDNLMPGAYKADLWRYCVLYIHGGIYLDIKLNCINGFKLIYLTGREHFVFDRVPPLSIYNALMISKPKNILFKKAINKIIQNVNSNFYGDSGLEPTGPVMLGKLILQNKFRINTDMYHYKNGGFIIYKNCKVISTGYSTYSQERKKDNLINNKNHYAQLWRERKIYKNFLYYR